MLRSNLAEQRFGESALLASPRIWYVLAQACFNLCQTTYRANQKSLLLEPNVQDINILASVSPISSNIKALPHPLLISAERSFPTQLFLSRSHDSS